MGLRKGQTNNPKGRPKGSKNKVTANLRNWVQSVVIDNRQQFTTDLQLLEPYERVKLITQLLGYVLPRLQAVETAVNFNDLTDEQINIIVDRLKD